MKVKLNKKTKKRLKNATENYSLLKTSWNEQTKTFFEKSTLHGVRYIAEKDRPFIEKFMWFACVAIGAIATIVIIVSLWEKFQTNPTITGLDTDFHNWEVSFPAITLCQEIPSNESIILDYIQTSLPGSDTDDTKKNLSTLTQLSYTTLPDFGKYSKHAIIPDDTHIKSLVFKLMNKCEDIFDECVWKSKPYNCCDGFFPVFTESGFCYTFNSRHYERSIPGSDKELPQFNIKFIEETDLKWSLRFTVRTDEVKMPIYILNSDEQAGLDIQPQHIWDFKVARISFSVKTTYTTEDTKQLSIKQRHCAFENEIKLKTDHIYTYTACTRQCRMDTAMKKCNCVPHFYPEIAGSYRHCRISELGCIIDNLEKIKYVDKCSCYLGCKNTVYEVEKLSETGQTEEEDPNTLEAEFVSWPMVRYKREVLFGWVDLLVSFGGIAGLFLGFSLLSGVEILYYFTIRACCMVVREKEKLRKIRIGEARKPPPEYDLSLVPYFISDPLPGNGINEVVRTYRSRKPGFNNKIIQVQSKNKSGKAGFKLNPKDVIIPPFGIEFIN